MAPAAGNRPARGYYPASACLSRTTGGRR